MHKSLVLIVSIVASLLSAIDPTAGQEATPTAPVLVHEAPPLDADIPVHMKPIVWERPVVGKDGYGFTVECPRVRLSVATTELFEGQHIQRCGTPQNPDELMFVIFSCQSGTDVVHVRQEGRYGGFTDIEVKSACGSTTNTPREMECKMPTGTAHVLAPSFGESSTVYACITPKG